ncbi:hypothetical protein E0W68_10315 [Flavobacterium salilacus subsp. salilacus]|uniref:hypothetical protein n=1 Tax=Flavobacterium TaxID=237 RepID=UPI0010750A69|nr:MULTISPECIES: hypothetical protein [Flavobacterium]KAF2518123.1 hypothetical protein E0W68_10315 [Flavobacterium salilacus subsp. salilacus]MBE1615567.1 hypothetical protein [Flavobacterium sp. SaA2.13]
MRKLLLLPLLFLVFACSDDDSNSTDGGSSATEINPPEWAQGTWLFVNNINNMGLKFTVDDVCNVNYSIATCHKENLVAFQNAGGFTKVEETVLSTEYIAHITTQGSVVTYHVKKISSTQIEWVLSGSQTLILTKQ